MKVETAWDRHVRKYRQRHPKATLKEAMIKASKTYKKGSKVKKTSSKKNGKRRGSGTKKKSGRKPTRKPRR